MIDSKTIVLKKKSSNINLTSKIFKRHPSISKQRNNNWRERYFRRGPTNLYG